MSDDTGSAGPSLIDLMWMGRPRCIGVWRVGDNLIDCGPRTCAEQLIDALGDRQPRRLILTHIHFDHAGAAGTLVRRWPDLQVVVHRRGARHLVSPERLEASARRVFGKEFDARFGTLDPVPKENIRPLDGGEVVDGLRSAATPGHASHHLAFLHDSGYAFVGDVAGVRLDSVGPVLLPTPPPDIDLELWATSVGLVSSWQPQALALSHFGLIEEPGPHLDEVRHDLKRQAKIIHRGATPAEYVATMRGALLRDGAADRLDDYEVVVPLAQNHAGLARWCERME